MLISYGLIQSYLLKLRLQELVEAGAFNDSMMSMSYDEMVEGFAAGQGAMLYQANWTSPSISGRPQLQ